MKEKVVLITGGSRGIGAETAMLAASNGWNVCISYKSRKEEAQKVVSFIEKQQRKALAIQADVGREDDVLNLFAKVNETFGRLDALVNNAGIIFPECRLEEMQAERFRRIFSVNVIGALLCSREAVKRMSSASGGNGGVIVNVSSIASRLGSPKEFIDYAATKGAIDTMTVGLAKEVAETGIRVNAVRPGLIATELHRDSGDINRPERLKENIPMKRVGHPKEVAASIVWLLSDEASYVTGALLDVSGGR